VRSLSPLLPPLFPADLSLSSPFSPDFLGGLEAAGYLQRLDVSESRITARFQHGLAKMNYPSLSEAFTRQAGIKTVHRSTVQFFNEAPISDPYVHVMVGALPAPVPFSPSRDVEWVAIQSNTEAEGTSHWTLSVKGFWPLTVVFDVNQSHLFREDNVRFPLFLLPLFFPSKLTPCLLLSTPVSALTPSQTTTLRRTTTPRTLLLLLRTVVVAEG
jgi:hypothetical protein